jgi:hypothetical protein
MKGLNLRVYRRTLDGIALLWNKEALDKSTANDIIVTLEKDDGARQLEFKTSDQVENALDEVMTAPDNTIVMMISHEKNKIDPYQDVKLNIKFGDKVSQDIFVYGFGVLPPMEKDDKKQNQHIYGYVEGERKWAKMPLVRLKDGTLAVPIVVKKD